MSIKDLPRLDRSKKMTKAVAPVQSVEVVEPKREVQAVAPKPLAADIAEAVAAANEHANLIYDQAERLLEAVATDGREPTKSEMLWLRSRTDWDDEAIRVNRRRVTKRVRAQAVAGTTSDREALSNRLSKAEDIVSTRGSEIELQIAALTAERDAMLAERDTLARRKSQVDDALQELTECLSPSRLEVLNDARNVLSRGIGRELSDSRSRLQLLEIILAGPEAFYGKTGRGESSAHATKQDYFSRMLHSVDRDSVEQNSQYVAPLGYIDQAYGYSAAWPAAKARFEAEVSELRTRVEQLTAEFDGEIESLKEFEQEYWR